MILYVSDKLLHQEDDSDNNHCPILGDRRASAMVSKILSRVGGLDLLCC
jgi:hypothetical protein